MAGVVGPEPLEDARAGHRGRQRQRPAGQRLGQGDDVGPHPGLLEGEHRARASETGEDLVENQQDAVSVGQFAQPREHLRVMQQHAAGALHQGLDQHAGDPPGMALQVRLQGRQRGLVARQRQHVVLGQQAAEHGVHPLVRVAHRHGAEGVAMVAAAKRHEARAAALALVEPELHGHFHGHLHRHRTRIGVEHAFQPRPQQRAQAAGQVQRRLVRQAAEHHMRHAVQLLAHRLGDMRVVVAMAGRPPRGHAVDQRASVGQLQQAAVAAHHRQRRRGGLHLRIGQPDMGIALGHPGRRGVRHARFRKPGAAPAAPLQCSAFYGQARLALSDKPGRVYVQAGFPVHRRAGAGRAAPGAPPPAPRRRDAPRPAGPRWPHPGQFLQQRLPGTGAPPAAGRARQPVGHPARRRRAGLAAGMRQPGPARTGRSQAGAPERHRGRLAAGQRLAGQRRGAAGPVQGRGRAGRAAGLHRPAQPRQPAPWLPGRRRAPDPLPP
ncbi:Uncharacterised protein [Bordetella pertussis]|nr:Uncharacterised protein [Bordetella pertussis]CFO79029.1 Uncharacterised protein [Bordetella pertussis]CFP60825.1 Uncharacterised protein [Bordetella pertussis]CPL79153.1 Uncharacterised protein [Bordetella pertussis]CPM26105.1 Uncharacterised protein [Bordetella pertussis]